MVKEEKNMRVELKRAYSDEKKILKNLLEKYDYGFSQWDKNENR